MYFYKGVPLSKYCKENDINLSTVRTRIWKKKQNEKYSQYTEQEIVNMVIEAYGSGTKYMYKGILLRQYCIENDINYGTISKRIISLKKQNPDLSNDELVILAMEKFENKNFKFFYQGIPLKEYCKKHPEINYRTIISFINCEIEKNPNLSIQETIEKYMAKEHKGIYKYYYCGIPLKQYCEENNLSHRNIISYMSNHKRSEFQNLSDDEFIERIMKIYQPFEPKYLYKGLTLRRYCEQNDFSYSSVVSFVKRKLAKNSSLNIDDLIEEGIHTINRYGIMYYYKGVPLKDYAKENGLNLSSIRGAILRKKAKTDQPLQEIVNECVETIQKLTIKYYYGGGVTLYSYCKKIGLNYTTVLRTYLDKYSSNSDIFVDDAIKEIVDYYIEHPPIKTKYYFREQSLAQFCDEKGYSYDAIIWRIKSLENKDVLENTEQRIEESIRKYEERLKIKKINETFEQLKLRKMNTEEEIIKICEFLKIDYENVTDLINMDFSYNQAINMIWYFSDKENSDHSKLLTDKKINEIFTLVEKMRQSNEENIKDFELYDLIGIYKSELYDTRNQILLRQKRYLYKTIYSLCSSYNIAINKNNFDDFESEIKMYLIILLNRTHLNGYGQIIKYMDLTIKGYFRKFLKKYNEQNEILSLDEAKFSKEKGMKNGQSRMDFMADTKSQFELEETAFSTTMMEVLSNLPQEDVLLIMLKYQEDYTDHELAEYFKIAIDEVREKEVEILSALKNNGAIQRIR